MNFTHFISNLTSADWASESLFPAVLQFAFNFSNGLVFDKVRLDFAPSSLVVDRSERFFSSA
jgi:hypothetical protein